MSIVVAVTEGYKVSYLNPTAIVEPPAIDHDMVHVSIRVRVEIGRELHDSGREGETHGIYCSLHKKDGMIDVIRERCDVILFP